MDYFQYKHKEVRDLAWVIRSPFLICEEGQSYQDDFCQHHFKLMEDYLGYLDRKPSELFSVLGELRSPYLGHYFEKLCFFWVRKDPELKLIANNIQVKAKGRTLGEIDLIVESEGRTEHWELAVKFYLATGNAKNFKDWVGPNPVDRFDLKLNKIKSRQLELSSTAEAARELEKYGISQLCKKYFIKGYLYYSLNKDQEPFIMANPYHNRSWWLYEDQIDLLRNKELVRKEKRQWLSQNLFQEEDLVPFSRIPNLLRSRKLLKPQLFSIVEKQGKEFVEISSGFIALRNWPEKI
jgi:hypothetical protein